MTTEGPERRQTFWRYIQKAVSSRAKAGRDDGLLVARERAVEEGRRDAVANQGIHLVLHQRDEGGDHDCQARPNESRSLEAERLAAAGRQHRHRVATLEDRLHRFALERLEARVPPVAREDVLELRRAGQFVLFALGADAGTGAITGASLMVV